VVLRFGRSWCFTRPILRVMGLKYVVDDRTGERRRPLQQRHHCGRHVLLLCASVLSSEAATYVQLRGRESRRRRTRRMPAWLTRDAMADGGERIDLWTRCAAKAAMRRRRSGARCRVLVSATGDARPPNKSTTTKVATDASGACERRGGGETQSGDMVAGLHARWRRHAVAVRCCVGSRRKGLM